MEIPSDLIERLKTARSVVFFSGAGISAESGIPTFRGKDGIWNKLSPEELANFNAFINNPKLVWEWYNYRKSIVHKSKPNAGHLAIVKLEKFSVANTIESLQNLYAGDSLVNFQVIDDSTNSNIESDKVQINRLFMNLIQNGVEAGKELNGKAKIEIQLNNLNGFIEITIKDYSGGIPAAMKENMFRPNFTTKSAGTGLGLAICKGIVEQANGTIHYQTVDGVGTTFTVQLPTTNIN